ncbi:hypothetical protein GALL_493750 [mine drainage metagenome]|uniref:Uncharacterized protein n=1 Tax=mine drainage metagenome TaxID=410659 RepID=A0A1J5PUQ9_9ZZZZ
MASTYDRNVYEAGQVAGNKNEKLGCVAKAIIAQGQPGNDIVRNVIEEDHPQPYAAEQIEPEVTFDGMRERYLILIGHHAIHFVLLGIATRVTETILEYLRRAGVAQNSTASRLKSIV